MEEKREWDPWLDSGLGVSLSVSLAVYEAVKADMRRHEDEAAERGLLSAQKAVEERDGRNVIAGLVFSSDEPDPMGAAMAEEAIAAADQAILEQMRRDGTSADVIEAHAKVVHDSKRRAEMARRGQR